MESTQNNGLSGVIFTAGDGKGITVPEQHRMVKIAEKKIGKGKGKTVAFALVPFLPAPNEDEIKACLPMLNDLCEELQKDILTRMQRNGSKAVSLDELSYTACVNEYASRSFSSESIGAWFDSEVNELLAFTIATSKGWNVEALEPEQIKVLETKCAAYRASYVEMSARMPSLNPQQRQELLRVLKLLELTGSIASRMESELTPKVVSDQLGF